VAYDLHPNYLATRYALNRADTEGIAAVGVQHHHAHIVACMAENGLSGKTPVIGVSFDGTGYGADGAIWGGEFLLSDYQGFTRAAHLAYTPLPGGDVSVRKPARTALAFLWQSGLPWDAALAPVQALCAEECSVLRSQLERGINSPLTSSMGRLFDAAASLAGIRQLVNYEAQAAIELEAQVEVQETGVYPFDINISPTADNVQRGNFSTNNHTLLVSPAPILQALLNDVYAGVRVPIIAARFHNGIAQMTLDVCRMLRNEHGINDVLLSGGVWQNTTLLKITCQLIRRDGFKLYTHHLVPPNDGGVSLGQAAIAAHSLHR
jgi:hydrogenase maturation protein HypF